MKCRVCRQSKRGACLCQFCMDCIKEHGHEGCREKAEEKEKKKD